MGMGRGALRQEPAWGGGIRAVCPSVWPQMQLWRTHVAPAPFHSSWDWGRQLEPIAQELGSGQAGDKTVTVIPWAPVHTRRAQGHGAASAACTVAQAQPHGTSLMAVARAQGVGAGVTPCNHPTWQTLVPACS